MKRSIEESDDLIRLLYCTQYANQLPISCVSFLYPVLQGMVPVSKILILHGDWEFWQLTRHFVLFNTINMLANGSN